MQMKYIEYNRITNCVNCGAPLHKEICEYCGTEYKLELSNEPDITLDEQNLEYEIIERTLLGNKRITYIRGVKETQKSNLTSAKAIFRDEGELR